MPPLCTICLVMLVAEGFAFFLPATLVFLLWCKGTTIYFFTGEGMVYVKREKERARKKDGRREQMERGRQKGQEEKDRDRVGGVFLTVQC